MHHCVYFSSVSVTQNLGGYYQRQPRIRRKNKSAKHKFACQNCPSSFKLLKYLNYHTRYECGKAPRFKCGYCNYEGKYSSNTRTHIRRKHPDFEMYIIDQLKQQHF